jgi:hypothetical protein
LWAVRSVLKRAVVKEHQSEKMKALKLDQMALTLDNLMEPPKADSWGAQ